jgi:hypothetical protein
MTDGFKQVQLWHVRGVTGEFYTTKLAAEVRARAAFPHESPGADRLYARVYFTKFYKEV